MSMEPAPLFEEHHPGPPGGVAHWVNASDGPRIRVGAWNQTGPNGTVMVFPGRTEYIEKYAVTAQELASRGFASLAIDWRGQGLADRLLDDDRTGHVGTFPDYQKDVAAMLRAARELSLPRPYFLLAHSMGAGIGLRSVMEGMPVRAVAFTGPMWGIQMSAPLRPVAWVLGRLMPALGLGHKLAPSTVPEPYVVANPFEDNTLTTDPEMWQMMGDHLRTHPELALGGPSYNWLHQALEETKHLDSRPSPNLPCIAFLGTNERIVDPSRIHSRMSRWTDGELIMIEGGEHEVLMEGPDTRRDVFDKIAARFLKAAG